MKLISQVERGVVVDGRDIGTVILPNADLKIFLTASDDIRARRRYNDIRASQDISYENVLEDMRRRDYEDLHRKLSPLKRADDAIIIDNENLTIEEQISKVSTIFEEIVDNKKR
jgi:cytidylate kinase